MVQSAKGKIQSKIILPKYHQHVRINTELKITCAFGKKQPMYLPRENQGRGTR